MRYSLIQKIVWAGLALIVVTFLFGPFALGSAISGGARNGVDPKGPSHIQGITLSRQLLVSDPERITGYTFYGTTIPSNVVATLSSGSGTATSANGWATVSTGTTSNSRAEVYLVHSSRLVTGYDNVIAVTVRIPTGAANNTRAWGAKPDTIPFGSRVDGVYWKVENASWSICRMNASVETCAPSASWSGNAAATCRTLITSASTTTHVYNIQQDPMVAAFDINGEPCHSLTVYTGTGAITQSGDYHVFAANENTDGSTTNVSMNVVAMSAIRHGTIANTGLYNTRINANGTYSIKPTNAYLKAIVINSRGGTNNTLTVYDSPTASGTIIGVIDTTAQGGSFVYETDLDSGLTLVLVTGTLADITVVWN